MSRLLVVALLAPLTACGGDPEPEPTESGPSGVASPAPEPDDGGSDPSPSPRSTAPEPDDARTAEERERESQAGPSLRDRLADLGASPGLAAVAGEVARHHGVNVVVDPAVQERALEPAEIEDLLETRSLSDQLNYLAHLAGGYVEPQGERLYVIAPPRGR